MKPKIVQFKMNVSQSEKSLRDKISRLESELGRVKRWRRGKANRGEKRQHEEQIGVLRQQNSKLERDIQQLKHGKQT